jgi:transposase
MRARRPYPTDLSDDEWEILKPLIPEAKPGGRPRVHQPRELLNAIFYVLRGGCAWRLLPHDFLPWQTAYHYFRAWRMDGTWERIHATLHQRLRRLLGRAPTPSAAIIDSQSRPRLQRRAASARPPRSRKAGLAETGEPPASIRSGRGARTGAGPRHTPDQSAEEPPIPLPTPSNEALRLLKAALHTFVADERVLEGPEDLTDKITAQMGLYSQPCQDSRTSDIGPPHELLTTPRPRIVGILT